MDSSLTHDRQGRALPATRGAERLQGRAEWHQHKRKSCLTVTGTVEAEAYSRVTCVLLEK